MVLLLLAISVTCSENQNVSLVKKKRKKQETSCEKKWFGPTCRIRSHIVGHWPAQLSESLGAVGASGTKMYEEEEDDSSDPDDSENNSSTVS
jgi:hypothetical protein